MHRPGGFVDLAWPGVGVLRLLRTEGRLSATWRFEPPELAAFVDAELASCAAAIRQAIVGDESALAAIPTPDGTAFERRVWECARSIPRGETRTYGWIADRTGSSRAACRAVGQALRKNPLPIVVPCHRVVASNGSGGYAGARDGPLHDVKLALLRLESASGGIGSRMPASGRDETRRTCRAVPCTVPTPRISSSGGL